MPVTTDRSKKKVWDGQENEIPISWLIFCSSCWEYMTGNLIVKES